MFAPVDRAIDEMTPSTSSRLVSERSVSSQLFNNLSLKKRIFLVFVRTLRKTEHFENGVVEGLTVAALLLVDIVIPMEHLTCKRSCVERRCDVHLAVTLVKGSK